MLPQKMTLWVGSSSSAVVETAAYRWDLRKRSLNSEAGRDGMVIPTQLYPDPSYPSLTVEHNIIANLKMQQTTTILLSSLGLVSAYGPWSSGGNPWGGGGYGGQDDSGSDTSTGFPGISSGSSSFAGFDISAATHYRTIHGILAAIAFIGLFPLGSILMRIVPGKFAIWAHAITQIVAYIVFAAAAALGFYLVHIVRIPFGNGNLLSNDAVNYHPIIGIVVLAALLIQPVLGLIHHARFKRLRRRQVWSYLHIWNGRIFITLGIINGGLGLGLARAGVPAKVAYSVVAAVMWILWVLAAIFGEAKRARAARKESRRSSRSREWKK
ncbi:uncharacterized protein E0L32_001270 [Thyridium curvatum]|uniref:Cytochrome b561 domain-containing protein n=1 Tax=Thyridium curvatum TaxID=1093900 RepID=A0A507AQK8_9PEZI|nr:uncharacterized protein E0L32_001270 [Thyridium curvatum]TPX10073.1 hypothetical protein E0L32_001270 [Thyridium curvatum]